MPEPSLLGDIRESSVTIVMQEHVVAPKSNVQVHPPVVVVITRADALAPTGYSDASFLCHICEGPIAIVVIQVAGGLLVLLKALQSSSVDQKDVRPSVIVVIEERRTAAGGFDDIFFRFLSAVLRLDPQSGTSSNILKMDPRWSR